MNAKILIIFAVIGLGALLALVASSTQNPDERGSDDASQVLGLFLNFDSISVKSINDYGATFEINFNVTNPNPETILLQYVKYQVYVDGERMHVGLVGERPTGFVASSNFITLIQDSAVKINDKFSLNNDGSDQQFWDDVRAGTVVWTVNVETSYNFSSFVAGGENLETFEFKDVLLS